MSILTEVASSAFKIVLSYTFVVVVVVGVALRIYGVSNSIQSFT